jgi:translation elongation factor EF-Tu-like GTPase
LKGENHEIGRDAIFKLVEELDKMDAPERTEGKGFMMPVEVKEIRNKKR